MKKIWILFPCTLLTLTLLAMPALAKGIVRVTYQKGDVYVGNSQKGPWQSLSQKSDLDQGRFIKTGPEGIVELTLPDRSVLRLAPKTIYGITEAVFTKEKKRKRWSAKLILGRMWSKISRSVGGLRANNFDTHTPTAVVGVRGTVFNVDAGADTSTEVSVFEGRVGVEPPLVQPGAAKEEMAWPTQVSEKQWEEIIVGKLQRLRIGADGRPGKPSAFDPDAEKDAWVDWNRNRDANLSSAAQ